MYRRFFKRTFDFFLALLAILFLWPAFLLIALVIRHDSEGPVFFKQKRVGYHGRLFLIYKFRTMVQNAEELKNDYMKFNEADGPVFKIKNDPRFTHFGRFLARTGLDELPQLINVLRGEMSLVGPRPLPVEEERVISSPIRSLRKNALPGMTSPWVILGSHRLSFHEWMDLDRQYIRSMSFYRDVIILWQTCILVTEVILRSIFRIQNGMVFGQYSLELFPFILLLSLLPFLRQDDSSFVTILFLAFPFLYMPVLFRQRRSFSRSFFIIFFAWVVYLFSSLFSTVFSISWRLSVPAFMLLLASFLYFITVTLMMRRLSDLRLLSVSILSVGIILSFRSLFLLFTSSNIFYGMNLTYATFGHSHLADYLLYAIPICATLFIRSSSRSGESSLVAILLFLFINFYLTFARTAYFVLAISVFVLIWQSKPAKSKALLLILLVLIPYLIVAGSSLAISGFDRSHLQRFPQEIRENWLLRQIVKLPELEPRTEFFQQAFHGFSLRPLLGNGLATFSLTSRRFQQTPDVISSYAHSLPLELLSETGIIGFSTFFFLLLVLSRGFRNLQKMRPFLLPLILGASASFFQSFLDFNFHFFVISLLFWTILASAVKLNNPPSAPSITFRPWFSVAAFACLLFAVSTSFSVILPLFAKKYFSSSSQTTYSLLQISTLLPSSNESRFDDFLRYIQDHPDFSLSDRMKSVVLSWNREDPDIYSRLAELDPDPQLYEALIVFDPLHSLRFLEQLFIMSLNQHDLQSAISYLEKAADVSHTHLSRLYPNLISTAPLSIDFPPKETELSQDFDTYLRTLPPTAFSDQNHPGLAQIFYRLGLIAYQHAELELTENLWKTAVSLAPEWSYFHIELINLYLRSEQPHSANQQVVFCLEFQYPAAHCREIMRDYSQRYSTQEVGFMSDAIQKL